MTPFHWEIEFPEVFGEQPDRNPVSALETGFLSASRETRFPKQKPGFDSPGFDCIVGNPPFAGKNTISNQLHPLMVPYLLSAYPGSNGKSDLVAFFFRRSFELIRVGGAMGLIATKTICQGDTRAAGLAWLCNNGGSIFAARKRLPWPGEASVFVSQVHFSKGETTEPRILEGKATTSISAFLFSGDVNSDPLPLLANSARSFQGCNTSGQGFLFSDDDASGTPLDAIDEITEANPRAAELIRPYYSGEAINHSAKLVPYRFVFGFGRATLEQATSLAPELVEIARSKVKPDRESRPQNEQSRSLAKRWWQWHTDRPTMQEATKGFVRVLVSSQVTEFVAVLFGNSTDVYGHTLNIFAFESHAAFSSLSSRINEVWVKFFCSSLGDSLRYTPSDCFETFPFPPSFESDAALEAAGQTYYEFRAELMVRNNEGLTKTYNRFHDPHETSADIATLRKLHAAMDRAVPDAYGGDLAKRTVPPCEFLLDYDDSEDEDAAEPAPGARQKKKPWRYRWPDAFRDEVLALLLELNKVRAVEERLAGPAEKVKKPGKKPPKAKKGEGVGFDFG